MAFKSGFLLLVVIALRHVYNVMVVPDEDLCLINREYKNIVGTKKQYSTFQATLLDLSFFGVFFYQQNETVTVREKVLFSHHSNEVSSAIFPN